MFGYDVERFELRYVSLVGEIHENIFFHILSLGLGSQALAGRSISYSTGVSKSKSRFREGLNDSQWDISFHGNPMAKIVPRIEFEFNNQ